MYDLSTATELTFVGPRTGVVFVYRAPGLNYRNAENETRARLTRGVKLEPGMTSEEARASIERQMTDSDRIIEAGASFQAALDLLLIKCSLRRLDGLTLSGVPVTLRTVRETIGGVPSTVFDVEQLDDFAYGDLALDFADWIVVARESTQVTAAEGNG